MSAVSRGHVTSDVEEGGGTGGPQADRVSIFSGESKRSMTTSQLEARDKLPWYRGVTCKDIKDITPTVLILIGGLLIMIFVIPYAFSSVIKQLEAEALIEAAREQQRLAYIEARKKAMEEEAAAAAAETTTLADTTALLTWKDGPQNKRMSAWRSCESLSKFASDAFFGRKTWRIDNDRKLNLQLYVQGVLKHCCSSYVGAPVSFSLSHHSHNNRVPLSWFWH